MISIPEDDLWGTRLLVFLEDKSHTNKYRQIYLDAEDFKKLSFQIGKVVGEDENKVQKVEIRYSDDIYELPDLKQIN